MCLILETRPDGLRRLPDARELATQLRTATER
jgi:hypothetical protein